MVNKSTPKSRRNIIEGDADAYAMASGKSFAVRSVKSQIYGAKKALPARAGGASDTAPAGAGDLSARAEKVGIVPIKARVLAPEGSPINNMGENYTDGAEVAKVWPGVSDEDLGEVSLVISDSGEIKTLMHRKPAADQVCIVDWINFTVLEDTFFKTAREILISDEQIVTEASRQFEKIFGFGVTRCRDRSMNFYRDSWVLGDDMGFVCFGGQRSTMLVTLTGQGCSNAIAGWEGRLYNWLTSVAIRPSISRIDLAHDDIKGEYLSVDWADEQWSLAGFTGARGGRPPEIQHLGNWKRPSGKGRTLTIGMRTSSKFCRFYEKGRKEGDRDSTWCRCEVEFKNANTVIPADVLLNPSQYFVGAYPCIALFATVKTPSRMDVKQRAAHINMDASVAVAKRQMGRYLRVFRELFGDKDALDMVVCEKDDYWPKRLKILTNDATSGPTPIHKQPDVEPNVPSWMRFITTVPCYGLNGENGFA